MEFEIVITGTAPLLMHSSRLSNPLDPAAKAMKKVTAKRTKTDDDYEEVARLEFAGGLYFDGDAGPYMPADNVHRSLLDAGKKTRRGPKVKEGVFIRTDVNPLVYKGPRTIDGLWQDEQFRHFASAKVQTQRVMRCRPIFRQWSTVVSGIIDEQLIDFEELVQIATTAGNQVGLGDWRPRFGRFMAEVNRL